MLQPRILVIEDDPGVEVVLRAVLEAEGYRVLSTASTLDPVDVSQLSPTLIVLDIWLDGDARGWDLLQELKVTPGARGIPVMICTADEHMVRREAARLGVLAVDVLLKPFDLDDLVARVAAVCVPGIPSARVLA